jgi:hypothetical protein
VKKWCKLELKGDETASKIIVELISKGFKLSDWIIDISLGLDSNLNKSYDLWLVSLSDFGFDGPTKIKDFYLELEKNGYKTVPPEIALILRKNYTDQPKTEWLRIATPLDAMIDRDGVPHLPKLGCALDNHYIETYWAWPEAIFHPHNEFIVEKNTDCL